MRVAVLLLAAVLVAGCTGGEDDTPPTATPPTATPTATPSPSPEPTPEPTPTTPTPTTPTPPTPNATVPVNVTVRHDFSNASENLTFTIPQNAEAGLVVTVQFDTAPTVIPGQYVCSAGLRIKVIRPDGSLQHDVLSSAGSGQGTHCGAVSASAGSSYPTDVPPGEWHASFEGAGLGVGWVFVRPAESSAEG